MEIALWANVICIIIAFGILILRISIQVKKGKNGIFDAEAVLDIGKRQIQANAYGLKRMNTGMMAILTAGEGRDYVGKVAALTTVRTFTKLYNQYDSTQSPDNFFEKAFKLANTNVLNTPETGKAYAGCLILNRNILKYGIVGHMNVYVFRGKELILLSKGQIMEELIKEKVNKGLLSKEAALRISDINRAYNFVGRDDYMSPLVSGSEIKLKKKDIVVMITESVQNSISVREMEEVLVKKNSCKEKAREIIEVIKNKDKETANLGLILIGI